MQGNELRKKKKKFQLKKRQRFRKNHRRGHRTRERAHINITPQTYGTEEVCCSEKLIGYRKLRKCIDIHTFDDFVGWVVHQIVFSVARNSVYETLAALQTVKTVFRTQTKTLSCR